MFGSASMYSVCFSLNLKAEDFTFKHLVVQWKRGHSDRLLMCIKDAPTVFICLSLHDNMEKKYLK